MRFLQRLNQQPDGSGSGEDNAGADERLQQVRMHGDRLLAAGDEAIQRALAGSNSEAFLRAGRQQGGQ
ncbi:MAG: hypothetical protein ABR976_15010 [Terracidiphilus sp.]|jgi:hypothetical protein